MSEQCKCESRASKAYVMFLVIAAYMAQTFFRVLYDMEHAKRLTAIETQLRDRAAKETEGK